MTVALYARVSTSDQKCESQLNELYAWCSRHNWRVRETYVDTASGSKADRVELARLMEDARHKRFDAVLVWTLDRFGRSVINLRENIDKLKLWGIHFLATSQGIDTREGNGAAANFMLNILAAVAEFEREMISERVRAGVANARRKGATLGRPRRVVDKTKVLELREAGLSLNEIAERLGCGRGTIERCLPKILPKVRGSEVVVIGGIQGAA